MTRTPVSTYRLQVTEEFDLFEAARRLPYLHELGVDWVYLSPLLQAEAGSDHGYDVVGHDRDRPGARRGEGLAAVSAEARRLGMGVLVDIVPNHVGVATPRGERVVVGRAPARPGVARTPRPSTSTGTPAAAGSGSPSSATTTGTPTTGRIDNLALADGELRYHDHRFPLAPGSPTTARTPNTRARPPALRARHWRVADAGLNYRRFFAVNTLAAIRVEDPQVLRRLARRDPPLVRRGPGRRAAGRPPRRPARPRRLPRRPGRAHRRRLRAGREDPRARRGAVAVLGDRRHHRVRRARRWSTGCSPTRRASGRSTRSRPGCAATPVDWQDLIHDTKRAVADGILRSEVRRITPRARGVDLGRRGVGRGAGRRCGRRAAGLLPGLPLLPARGPRAPRPGVRRCARPHRPDLADVLDVLAPVLGDPALRAAPCGSSRPAAW